MRFNRAFVYRHRKTRGNVSIIKDFRSGFFDIYHELNGKRISWLEATRGQRAAVEAAQEYAMKNNWDFNKDIDIVS